MCASMVDIQSATAESRQGKKKRRRKKNKRQDEKIYIIIIIQHLYMRWTLIYGLPYYIGRP